MMKCSYIPNVKIDGHRGLGCSTLSVSTGGRGSRRPYTTTVNRSVNTSLCMMTMLLLPPPSSKPLDDNIVKAPPRTFRCNQHDTDRVVVYFTGCPMPSHSLHPFMKGAVTDYVVYAIGNRNIIRATLRTDPTRVPQGTPVSGVVDHPVPSPYFKVSYVTDVEVCDD